MQVLLPDQVHIWLTDLQVSGAAADTGLLAEEELAHAQKISRPHIRERYLQVRAEVRRCLALYTEHAAPELEFARTPRGKPYLTKASQPLSFNLSHSGDCLALAVSAGQAVGVDCERALARRNWQAIAERYFHTREVAQLRALPEPEQPVGFYRCWTLKEAFFKARGTGIATGLDKAIFSINSGEISCELDPTLNEDPTHWQFRVWQWSQDFHLALAWENSAARLREVTFYHGGQSTAQILAPPPQSIATTNPDPRLTLD